MSAEGTGTGGLDEADLSFVEGYAGLDGVGRAGSISVGNLDETVLTGSNSPDEFTIVQAVPKKRNRLSHRNHLLFIVSS